MVQDAAFPEWTFLSRRGDQRSGAGGVQRRPSVVQRRTLGLQYPCHPAGEGQAGGQDLPAHWWGLIILCATCILCFGVVCLFVFLCASRRRSYLLGSGSLWHLPHLWFKGHVVYCVAGLAAGKPARSSLFILAYSHACTRRVISCHQSHCLLSLRAASPVACLRGRCRFSVDMTRRSPVWPSALNSTWLSQGQRSDMTV